MPWVERNSIRFWVGRHNTLGLMVVSETEIEKSRTDGGLLSAFVVPKDEVKRFKSDVLRTRIEQNAVTETEAIEALDAFVTFNHKNYLRKTGRPLASLLHAEHSPVRSTHCYNCQAHLDSSSHLKCSACGWLVCTCGACGCSYDG